ncbi:MAG: SDR family oxidoreductase [Rhodocyclaceae bacterium]|nr:SDR family oxidoreductase [Rhodocyclaceae bacterium]
MTWTLDQVPQQKGRLAVVTGANIGLGFETAMALAAKNCDLVLACRNMEKAEAAKATIHAKYPKAKVTCMQLDLSSLKSVRAFATAFAEKYSRLDLLINNAGIMMPPYSLSEDGFESQFAANYIGHFALTGQLLPLIVKTPGARIVSLSSMAHRWGNIRFDDPNFKNGYNKREAYGQSKIACLMFAYEMNRRLQKAGCSTLSVAAHPGVAYTNLTQHMPKFVNLFAPLMGIVLNNATDGALPTLYAALGDDIHGGDYCGPKDMQQMRGAPIKVGSNRASRDEKAAAKLWAMSEVMSGVKFLS